MGVRVFQRGETPEFYVEVKTSSGTLVNPSSIVITITDSAGTVQVNGQAMSQSNSDTGKYVYYYAILATDALGWWTVKVLITDTGSKYTIVRGGFEVEL